MVSVPGRLPGVDIYHNTKIKIYPDGKQKIVLCSKPIFKDNGYEKAEWKEPEPKPKNMSNEVRDDSMRRAKQKIFDIARCNDFQYFITWTLSKEKVNRYDPKEVSKKLKKYLDNLVQRNDARYLIIPEHHKDGAIHMHGLLSGNFKLEDSGHKTKRGQVIYNMPQWSLGWSTAIALDSNKEAVSKYITKYVEKAFRKIFGSFYYAGGHGLIRTPDIKLVDSDYTAVNVKEYSPEGVNLWFKYVDVDSEEE